MANYVLVDNDELVKKIRVAAERAESTGDEMMIALILDILRSKRGAVMWYANHDEPRFGT